MKALVICSAIAFVIPAFAESPPVPPAPAAAGSVDSLDWLAGCWAGGNGRAEFHEQWMKPLGGMMLGMSRTVVGGKVVAYESMRIHTREDGKVAFTPKPSGKAEATFLRQGDNPREARFEVKRDEFPQRVIYRLNEDGTLAARIEGERDGKVRAVDYPMKRVACDS
jgi:hypothetical protein